MPNHAEFGEHVEDLRNRAAALADFLIWACAIEAPPLRNLHERYPVEDLEESLAEAIRTGHPAMPEFALD